jgi:hypothetical protein
MSIREREYSEWYHVLSYMYAYVCIASSICFGKNKCGMVFCFLFPFGKLGKM